MTNNNNGNGNAAVASAAAVAPWPGRLAAWMPRRRRRTVDEAEDLFRAVRAGEVSPKEFGQLVCASKGAYRGLAEVLVDADLPLDHDPARARAVLARATAQAARARVEAEEAGSSAADVLRAELGALQPSGVIRDWVPAAGSVGSAWVVARALEKRASGLRIRLVTALRSEAAAAREAERLAEARWLAAAAASSRGRRLVEAAIQAVRSEDQRAALGRGLAGVPGPSGRGRDADRENQWRTRGRRAALGAVARQARAGAGPLATLIGVAGCPDPATRRGRSAEAMLVVRAALSERVVRPDGVARAREAVMAELARAWPAP